MVTVDSRRARYANASTAAKMMSNRQHHSAVCRTSGCTASASRRRTALVSPDPLACASLTQASLSAGTSAGMYRRPQGPSGPPRMSLYAPGRRVHPYSHGLISVVGSVVGTDVTGAAPA
ncbi:hypothetical protein GCM10027262_44410 [Nocardia tengchongensis]